MRGRDLSAAGILDPDLRASYERCRTLAARHGRTYYLATLLLPPAKRPYVHALYAYARVADEIVDGAGRHHPGTADRLREWGIGLATEVRRGRGTGPVRAAVVDTVQRWDIPGEHFTTFIDAMAQDLSVSEYPTYADLLGYVHGSAAVIGLQMVPILEPLDEHAYPAARDLGIAFQLANFVRDVGEDLDRGRVYLPLEDLERFGLARSDLERRVVDDRVRALLAFEIARVRRLAAAARQGVAHLAPSSRPCIETARTLYCGIVDQVEELDYQVFDHRASVPLRHRARVAGRAWLRSRRDAGGSAGPATPSGRTGRRLALETAPPPEHPQVQGQQH